MARVFCAGLALLAFAVPPASAQGIDRAIRIIEEAPKLPDAAPPAVAPQPPAESKNANPAGIAVDILPGKVLPLGTQIIFRVTVKKPGWLILVDIDSTGKLTQIFPNGLSSIYQKAAQPGSNKIEPGQTVQVPDAAGAKDYEFVASPPAGTGMIVAMLSDRPVDVVDLPDVPAALAGQPGALDFVKENTRSLRIMQEDESEEPLAPQWSFDTKTYAIR